MSAGPCRALIALLYLSLAAGAGCRSANPSGKVTLTFIEYNRGAGSPGSSDLTIEAGSTEARFHDVRLVGDSFFPDDSIIPNAFVNPLLHLDFEAALDAFTEPYYGIRVYRFFEHHPRWGIGLDFTHLKAFMADTQQEVAVTGASPDVPAEGRIVLGDRFESLNVSHGVNHVAIHGVYRWMLLPTAGAPDGRLQPFVSLGAGPAVPHLELTLRDKGELRPKSYSYQLRPGNWSVGAGAGVRWKAAAHFGVYTEYRWTQSILGNMRFDNGEEGRVKMRFSSHHMAWGIYLGL
jgi:hypothetical protein